MATMTRWAFLLAVTAAAGLAEAAPSPLPDKVGAPVWEALRGEARVRVLVYLDVPAAAAPRRASLPDVRAAVREAQDAALQQVPPDHLHLERRMEAVPAFAATVSREGLERLAAAPGVVRVDLDAGGSGGLAEAVPLTHTSNVQALGYTGAGVTVAVIDSGIDHDHPDLGDDLVGEACFCSDNGLGCCPAGGTTQMGAGAAEDDQGHGTHVSGIVTSRGTVAPKGTAPDANIVAVKVLDENNAFCCTSDVVAALDWVLNNRPDVKIVNMSLGTSALFSGDCDSANLAFANVINALRANDVLSFVASLNSGSLTQMSAPACIHSAVSVGATYDANVGPVGCDPTTAADQIACFSNRNSVTDILAPGALITSTYLNGSAATLLGTSMASPHVAGCAADLLQAMPDLSPDALEAALEGTGVPVHDPGTGLTYPRVDCLAALNTDPCVDGDGDTYLAGAACGTAVPRDCDDADAAVHPGAPETCDLRDDDCNAAVDEGVCVSSCPVAVLPSDGSTTSNLRAPSIRLRFGRSVYLLRASDLAADGLLPATQLRGISWAYGTAPGLAGSGSLKVYLQNTTDTTNTKSTSWTTAITGMTLVRNASTVLPNVTGQFGVSTADFTYTGGGLYVAFDWQYPTGTLSTTVTVQTETSLTNSLLGAQSVTSPPTTLTANNARPATWLDRSAPDSDLGVSHIRALGAVPVGLVGPQILQAVVTNRGVQNADGVPLSLSIAGTNPFGDVQPLSSPGCSGPVVVSFAPFAPFAVGANTVTVSAAGDEVPWDDSVSVPMDVTVNRYSYKIPGPTVAGGFGFTNDTGEFVARFGTTMATQIDAVQLEFSATSVTTYKVIVRADNGSGLPGALLYQDAANRTVTAYGPQTLRLAAPVAVGPGSFFVGLAQTNSVRVNLGAVAEVPVRPGTFYFSTTPGVWTDFSPGTNLKLNLGVNLGACLVPLAVNVVQDGTSPACAGGAIQLHCAATGGTGTVTYQWTRDGIPIAGATGSSYVAVQGAAGSSVYNCRAADDAGCLGIEDPTPPTAVWIADGGACDDGNGCTAGDTCAGSTCAGTPIQAPGEATGLGIQADKQTLFWNAAPGAATYDVARGRVGQFPVGSGVAETCLGAFAQASAVDATVPASGTCFWYLVRGRNTCGSGSWGSGLGAPRVTAVCP